MRLKRKVLKWFWLIFFSLSIHTLRFIAFYIIRNACKAIREILFNIELLAMNPIVLLNRSTIHKWITELKTFCLSLSLCAFWWNISFGCCSRFAKELLLNNQTTIIMINSMSTNNKTPPTTTTTKKQRRCQERNSRLCAHTYSRWIIFHTFYIRRWAT